MTETLATPEAAAVLAKSDQNLVWLDCEMTGLDPEKERIIEIAVVVTGPRLEPRVEGPVLVIHQPDDVLDAMDAWNKGTHGRSGLIDKVKASTLTEADAEAQILEFTYSRSKSVRDYLENSGFDYKDKRVIVTGKRIDASCNKTTRNSQENFISCHSLL